MAYEPMGFGIIGAGMVAGIHAEAIQRAEGLRLVCVQDVIEGRAQDLAERYGAQATGELDTLLAREDVEAVCVCTPSGLHRDQVIRAAEAGKHILCEKPLAIRLQDIDEMIQAARENRVKLAGVFQWRTNPGVQVLREAVRAGKLGKLVLGDCYQKMNRNHQYYAQAGWRATWELDGGGALMNQGVHGVDLIHWIMGRAVNVTAHCRRLVRNIAVEDTAIAMIEWDCGALGVLEGATSVTPGRRLQLEISGDRGTLAWEDGRLTAWDVPGEEQPVQAETTEGQAAGSDPKAIKSDAHQRHLEDLFRAVREGREPLVRGEDSRDAVEIVKAVYLSSREGGATVQLPLSYDDDQPGC